MGTERGERRTFPRSQHRESNNRLHFEALLEESSVRIDHYHLGIFKSSPAGITSFFPSGVSFLLEDGTVATGNRRTFLKDIPDLRTPFHLDDLLTIFHAFQAVLGDDSAALTFARS